MSATVLHGDCIELMRRAPADSIDAIVTDPPYGLGFMGKAWDDLPPGLPWAQECLRVLKPGGHLLAFGGTRTWHRLACAVEDAGFEVRDSIAWLYGSGFPKSLDVSKAIDKAAGATREVVATERSPFRMADKFMGDAYMSTQTGDSREVDADGYIVRKVTAPATDAAHQWQGWGTALKPAFEPVVVARKPLRGTVAANVLAHGTGALNVAACRVSASGQRPASPTSQGAAGSSPASSTDCTCPALADDRGTRSPSTERPASSADALAGRSDPPASARPDATDRRPPLGSPAGCPSSDRSDDAPAHGSAGDALAPAPLRRDAHTSPDRCATCGRSRSIPSSSYAHDTAPHVERTTDAPGRWPANVVLDDSQAAELDRQSGTLTSGAMRAGVERANLNGWAGPMPGATNAETIGDTGGASRFFYCAKAPTKERVKVGGVAHPTVKPLTLMRWLVRLVTPSGGRVLDPFAGSGTTLEACLLEGFDVIGIEREADYLPLIQARIDRCEVTS